MRERVGYATAVSDDVEIFVLGLKIFVKLDLHIVELDLDAVEQFAVPGAILSSAYIISMIPSRILFGRTRLRSPGVALRVGLVKDSLILDGVLRLP